MYKAYKNVPIFGPPCMYPAQNNVTMSLKQTGFSYRVSTSLK